MRVVWILLALLTTGTTQSATPKRTYSQTQYNLDSHLEPGRLRVRDLAEWISKEKIEDLDTLLDRIRQKGFAQNTKLFTLVHTSASLHRKHISPLFPRVVFTYQGLTGAVTGDPSDPASFQSLELIEFDETKEDFTFHLIEFPAKRGAGVVKVIPNPTECAVCHGDHPRPLWAAYPVWPGAYGSRNGNFTAAEQDNYAKFYAALDDESHRRYKKFGAGKTFENLPHDANLKVGLALNFLNFRKAMAQLKREPFLNRYHHSVVAASRGCDRINEFLPPEVAKAHERKLEMDYPALETATRQSIEREASRRSAKFNRLLAPEEKPLDQEEAGQFDFERQTIIASLRFILEGQSDSQAIDMSRWALSYAPTGRSYSFSNGHQGVTDFFQQEIEGEFPESNSTCEELKELSLRSFARALAEPSGLQNSFVGLASPPHPLTKP